MGSEQPSVQSVDWHAAVRQKAQLSEADLSQATVDELALHLEDLYAAALAEGADEATARGRAFEALDASPLQLLKHHLSRDSRHREARQADDAARAGREGVLV